MNPEAALHEPHRPASSGGPIVCPRSAPRTALLPPSHSAGSARNPTGASPIGARIGVDEHSGYPNRAPTTSHASSRSGAELSGGLESWILLVESLMDHRDKIVGIFVRSSGKSGTVISRSWMWA